MYKKNLVSWRILAPIIGDVLVSPWNLLIGGLLVSKLSFPYAFLSIIAGYTVLSLIFYYYGGLGFKFRKRTSEIIEPVFGRVGTKLFFSIILAMGQIGWFAIVNQIGGESLAILAGIPVYVGILIYAAVMVIMATLNLHRLAIVKSMIVVSSFGFLIYLITVNRADFNLIRLTDLSQNKETILWGISIVVASLMSFSSVSPDFMSGLKTRKDVLLTILMGLFLPGVLISALGAVLFLGKPLVLNAIIGVSLLAGFGHWFNMITNTDAAVAIYTPGYRLSYAFGWPFKISVLVAAGLGSLFSLLNIRSQLETWLSIIAGIYPSLVGVTVAHYFLRFFQRKEVKYSKTNWRSVVIILFSSMLIFVINISLLNWVVGLTSFVLYIAMTGVTIKIYIGKYYNH